MTVPLRAGRPRRRALAFVALLAGLLPASIALLAPPPAHAAPDDDRIAVSDIHVDSPKTYWRDGGFELMSEAGRELRPVEETLNYLGHGYDVRGQTWLFTVPERAPELVPFLGGPGTTWYQAPQLPFSTRSPIWAGFGADTAIPVEQFRNGDFSLDLVDVRGPGKVEMFGWSPSGSGVNSLGRLFSSSDPQLQSSALIPGSHTHNFTLFSEPGRYELDYRTSARGLDGALIASEERTLVWQVGGPAPGSAADPAPGARPADPAAFEFSIGPAGPGSIDPRDEGNAAVISQVSAAFGNGVTGTAELLNDGVHLADLPVRDGQASLVDFLGGDASKFQLRFTPAGAQAPMWTSAPLEYAAGRPQVATTGAEQAEPLAPAFAPASPRFEAVDSAPSAPASLSVVFAPGEIPGSRTVELALSDPAAFGFATIELFDPESMEYPYWHDTRFIRGGETVTDVAEDDSWDEGKLVRVTFRPHALVALERTAVELTGHYVPGQRFEASASIPLAPFTAAAPDPAGPPAPTTSPTPGPDAGSSPAAPADCSKLVLLEAGHIDIASAILDESGLRQVVRDDTGAGGPGSFDRDASEVAVIVPERASRPRTEAQADAQFDQILNPVGEPTYQLPFTQQPGLPWPGYSTERVDHAQLDGPLTLELSSFSGPGEFAFFTPSQWGEPLTVDLGSRPGAPRAIELREPTHAHGGWTFTEPGLYEIGLRYRGTLADGTALDSGERIVRVAVGAAGRDALCGSAAP